MGERLRAQARREGKSFSAYLADAGLQALESRAKGEVPPFQLVTFRGEGAVDGIDLDRSNSLLEAEDAASYGERLP